MERGHTSGEMEGCLLASTKMTRSKAKESISGKMAELIMETGKTENSMDLATILSQITKVILNSPLRRATGSQGSDRSGKKISPNKK
jgi:hypothetical protein